MNALPDAYIGEDLPIQIEYTDPETGGLVGVDDNNIGPQIRILWQGELVAGGGAMYEFEPGLYEYRWLSGEKNRGTGTYLVTFKGEFDGETKINETTITLR